MDIQTRKIAFVQAFLKLQSETVISQLEQILKRETENELKPFTVEEFNKRIDQSMEDSKNGRLTESSKLKAKMDQWR